jgi:hypothetical protein
MSMTNCKSLPKTYLEKKAINKTQTKYKNTRPRPKPIFSDPLKKSPNPIPLCNAEEKEKKTS